MTLAAMRLKMSQQKAKDLNNGLNNSLHMDISPSVLISSGMDLEERAHEVKLWLPSKVKETTELCEGPLCAYK